MTAVMLRAAVPVEEIVPVSVLLPPTFTLPKFMLVGCTLIAGELTGAEPDELEMVMLHTDSVPTSESRAQLLRLEVEACSLRKA